MGSRTTFQARRPSGWASRLLVGLLGLALLGSFALPSRESEQDHAREYLLKGAMIEKFLKYVEWPEESLGEKGSVMAIGVFGKDPFGEILDKVFQGKVHQNHPVRVVRITKPGQAADCQLLFVPRGEIANLPAIGVATRGHHTLLIGESKDFALQGGSINFYTEDKRLRFEVNPSQAKREGIKISSSLLKLARIVEEPKK